MKTQPTHTPTPWYLTELGNHYWFSLTPNGKLGFTPMLNQFMNKQNAAFIVRAVNAYQPMREALKSAKVFMDKLSKEATDLRMGSDLCGIGHYAKYHSEVLEDALAQEEKNV